MDAVHTDRVAPTTAPLSQAIKADGLLFVSGQVPRNPHDELLTGPIEEQTHQVMENIGAILDEAGTSFDAIVKATVFLTEKAHFSDFNAIYADYLSEPLPARSAFIVAELALEGIDVEVEVIASLR